MAGLPYHMCLAITLHIIGTHRLASLLGTAVAVFALWLQSGSLAIGGGGMPDYSPGLHLYRPGRLAIAESIIAIQLNLQL